MPSSRLCQVSTDHRPCVDQLLTDTLVKYRPTIGAVWAKCRWTKSYIGRDTSGTTIDRVSTHYRLTINRYIDRVSTEYRPTVDRLSTECRPLFSTAISTDISVDITNSKQDPERQGYVQLKVSLLCFVIFWLLNYFSSWEFRRLIALTCPCEYWHIDPHYVWAACGAAHETASLIVLSELHHSLIDNIASFNTMY